MDNHISDMEYRQRRIREQIAMRNEYLEALKDAPKVEARSGAEVLAEAEEI